MDFSMNKMPLLKNLKSQFLIVYSASFVEWMQKGTGDKRVEVKVVVMKGGY